MEAQGLRPDVVPYSILLNLHADLADVAAAERVFAEFARRGFVASVRGYTALMKARRGGGVGRGGGGRWVWVGGWVGSARLVEIDGRGG